MHIDDWRNFALMIPGAKRGISPLPLTPQTKMWLRPWKGWQRRCKPEGDARGAADALTHAARLTSTGA